MWTRVVLECSDLAPKANRRILPWRAPQSSRQILQTSLVCLMFHEGSGSDTLHKHGFSRCSVIDAEFCFWRTQQNTHDLERSVDWDDGCNGKDVKYTHKSMKRCPFRLRKEAMWLTTACHEWQPTRMSSCQCSIRSIEPCHQRERQRILRHVYWNGQRPFLAEECSTSSERRL